MVGVNSENVGFCKLSMEKWNTRLHLKQSRKNCRGNSPSNIPGDCLLPLLFCITLNALTHELNKADCVYQVHKTERKISHFLCMDDLKLLVRDEDKLENEIKIVKAIGKDINMNFVLKLYKI